MAITRRYTPCICGGIADCSCGERLEMLYRKILGKYDPRNDRFWVWAEWLSRGLPMP